MRIVSLCFLILAGGAFAVALGFWIYMENLDGMAVPGAIPQALAMMVAAGTGCIMLMLSFVFFIVSLAQGQTSAGGKRDE